jgi:hypothetical protein
LPFAGQYIERQLMRPREIDDMLLMRDRSDDLSNFCDCKDHHRRTRSGKGCFKIAVDVVAVLADDGARKAPGKLVVVMADAGSEEIPLARRPSNDFAHIAVATGAYPAIR